jgi:hypothetical protein
MKATTSSLVLPLCFEISIRNGNHAAKFHMPFFEMIENEQVFGFATALQTAMRKNGSASARAAL